MLTPASKLAGDPEMWGTRQVISPVDNDCKA
jgi:hypothetical protein